MSEIETVAWLHYWITWNHLSAWWDNEIMLRQHVSPPVRVHCSFASRFEGNPFVIPDTATCIMHSFQNAFTECDCPFFNFQLHLTRRNKIVTLTVTVTLSPSSHLYSSPFVQRPTPFTPLSPLSVRQTSTNLWHCRANKIKQRQPEKKICVREAVFCFSFSGQQMWKIFTLFAPVRTAHTPNPTTQLSRWSPHIPTAG